MTPTSGNKFSLLLLLGVVLLFLPSTLSQWCEQLPGTVTLSDLHSLFRLATSQITLCRNFVITGNRCDIDHPFVVSSLLSVQCDDHFSGSGHCLIDCPGSHFDIIQHGALFLDGMTLKGATTGSIKVNNEARLIAWKSTWEENMNTHGDGNGAAVYSDTDSSIFLVDSTFIGNSATGDGGALYIKGFITVSRCLLQDNMAPNGMGGALHNSEGSFLSVEDTIFEGNEAFSVGPAIFLKPGVTCNLQRNDGCGNVADVSCNGIFDETLDVCTDFSSTCDAPSAAPSLASSDIPSFAPSDIPSLAPSDIPSQAPSDIPSLAPSDIPSLAPSDIPSQAPSDIPSQAPSDIPSLAPLDIPSQAPSDIPSLAPSDIPSLAPSDIPSQAPSDIPSQAPSDIPSQAPSDIPSLAPSDIPSQAPSDIPSLL